MALIHDEHGHMIDHKKTGDSGTKSTANNSDAGGRSSGHNPGGISSSGDRSKTTDCVRTKSGDGVSSDSRGTGKQCSAALTTVVVIVMSTMTVV
jgi:hypothetical protein